MPADSSRFALPAARRREYNPPPHSGRVSLLADSPGIIARCSRLCEFSYRWPHLPWWWDARVWLDRIGVIQGPLPNSSAARSGSTPFRRTSAAPRSKAPVPANSRRLPPKSSVLAGLRQTRASSSSRRKQCGTAYTNPKRKRGQKLRYSVAEFSDRSCGRLWGANLRFMGQFRDRPPLLYTRYIDWLE